MPPLSCAPPSAEPIRRTVLPYSRQHIDEDDIAAVVDALRSALVTTGPRVEQFESAVASAVGAAHGVAVSSGTAALHAAMFALNIGPGDEVITTPMTFAATANAVVFRGGTPVFADVEADTLLLDPARVEARITPRTKAVIAVDYAGQPCDYDRLRSIADRHGLALVADACHALGGTYKGRPVGSLADLSTFSFHPVKHITTGEGGMVTADDPELARRLRLARNHGITADYHQRQKQGTWYYEMVELGFNYRITDIQCALGLSQLAKLPAWIAGRQQIARKYDAAFAGLSAVVPVVRRDNVSHAYHLYVIQIEPGPYAPGRTEVFTGLREEGIGVNVHYIPVHLHPYYRQHFGCRPGDYPIAEAAYEQMISLPIFPTMTGEDVEDVIAAVYKVITG